MTSQFFGLMPTGASVDTFTLTNDSGLSLSVLNYGGIVTSLQIPDRHGQLADVVLGFDQFPPYLTNPAYFGAIVGRIAGRVPEGGLTIKDRHYTLTRNDGRNHLHGGRIGLDKRLWTAQAVSRPDGADSLRLTYRSPEGEEGYPGNIDIAVTYTLTAANECVIESEAIADCVTPLSLTHHSYFNLAGEGSGPVTDHEIQILADAFVPIDAAMTPSGYRASVSGQPNDFRHPRRLGDALPQLLHQHGDLYLLRTTATSAPVNPPLVARVTEPHSGRVLEVSSDASCLQFYTGVALDGTLTGKSKRAYGTHAGLCLECQGYPDGTQHPEFGDILLRPGHPQRQRTTYAFPTF